MSTKTEVSSNAIVGGWSSYHNLTAEDKNIFNIALQRLEGVTYIPNAVSTQVVAGVNYRFKCSASKPPAYVIWECIVEIFQPLDGEPYITGIIRI
jgi:hypothetical protein